MELDDIITDKDIEGYEEPKDETPKEDAEEPKEEGAKEEGVEQTEDKKETEEEETKEEKEEVQEKEEEKTEEEDPQEKEEEKTEEEKEEEEDKKKEEEEEEEKKDLTYMEIAKEAYPDKEFENEEEAEEALKTFVKSAREYEEVNNKYNQVLIDIFERNPEALSLVRMMKEGATFEEALPYVVDPDKLVPKKGDPEWGKWEESKEKAKKEREKRKEEAAAVEKNLTESRSEMEDFAKEKGFTEEVKKKFFSDIDDMLQNISRGKITKGILEKFEKGLIFEEKIKQESEKAKIEGRNEAIKEKIKKEDKTKKGDRLPSVKSAGKKPHEEVDADDPVSHLAEGIDSFEKSVSRF